ncbi:MAG: cytochrome c [Deltaproteobacteria bacterium]|nr:cytochrome c [Deltaproteobacteria bacterium]
MLRHGPGRSALAVAAALALAGGCARPGRFDPTRLDPTSPASLAAAAEDFRAACAPCHGADARGTGPVAASLRQPPTDLTLLATRRGGIFPFDDTVAVIAGERAIDAHGTRVMPIWSFRLGGGDAASAVASIDAQRRVDMLARYLATLQRPAPPPTPTKPSAPPRARTSR